MKHGTIYYYCSHCHNCETEINSVGKRDIHIGRNDGSIVMCDRCTLTKLSVGTLLSAATNNMRV